MFWHCQLSIASFSNMPPRYVHPLAALCETYFIYYASLTLAPAPLYLFCTHSHLFRVGGEVYAHSTLQRCSGGRPTHFQDRGYTEGPVKTMRLTKGVSISLPSSPLLPRQADIVPTQSCVKFTGGLNWNDIVIYIVVFFSNINKAWSHYEQLRMTRSRASGNSCKDSRTL